MTSTEAPKKFTQCNRCRDAGFPGVMIGFVQGGVKKDGTPYWNLVDRDNTPHTHLSPLNPTIVTQTQATTAPPATTNGTKEQQIEKYHNENIQAWNNNTQALKELANSIK